MVKTAIENKQNLIVEGCYIPPTWQKDFEEGYLRSIEFVCLAMSDAYIDAHFVEIRDNACAIEARLDDSECSSASLKEDNRHFVSAFEQCGEKVTHIETNYEETIGALLEEHDSRKI